MSEENQAESNQAPVIVNGQYVKDLSFEVPGAPSIYTEMQGQAPSIPINVDVRVAQLDEKTFEVTLLTHIEAKLGERTAFIAEVAYAGVVTVNVPDEHLQPLLLIEVPRLLFPFVRSIVADLTRDGGFPPLMIQPIDFVQLYRSKIEAARQAEALAGEPAGNA